MTNNHDFTLNLFQWASDLDISIILARPKFNAQDFINTDLDILIQEHSIKRLVQSIRSNHYRITSYYKRTDGQSYYFYGYGPNQGKHIQIDFITKLETNGLEYLNIKDIFNRSYETSGITYCHPIDQFLIVLMTHGLKHQSIPLQKKHAGFIQTLTQSYPDIILENLIEKFGKNAGLTLFEELKHNGYSHSITTYHPNYLYNYWKTHGAMIVARLINYYIRCIILNFSTLKNKIIFLGVDGAGKTTLINSIKNNYTFIAPKIVHSHFLPALPGNAEINSDLINDNPHSEKERNNFTTILKFIFYAFRYWICMLWPHRISMLYLFDRYITDTYIDPKRFRIKNSFKKHLFFLLKLYPKPDISFLLDTSANIAQARKQEVSIIETERQINLYKKIIYTLPNAHILNSELSIQENVENALEHITQCLDKKITQYVR
jgi:thymidylate kinase